jgi:hypothetical protein
MSSGDPEHERDVGNQAIAHAEDSGARTSAVQIAVMVLVRLKVCDRAVPPATGRFHRSGNPGWFVGSCPVRRHLRPRVGCALHLREAYRAGIARHPQQCGAWQTGSVDRRKWFDSSQPQTLQIAVILLYINAVFAVIYALGSQVFFLPMILEGAAAYGIANERRFGYVGGIILSGLFAFGAVALFVYYGGIGTLLNVVFSVALFVALVHPMSRDYQRIWFK